MKQFSMQSTAEPPCMDKLSALLKDRPVFGGLLFSQMVDYALKEYTSCYVISSSCTFYRPTHPKSSVTYGIEYVQKVGQALIEIGISGTQPPEANAPCVTTIRGKILLSLEKEHKCIFPDYIPSNYLKKYLNAKKDSGIFLSPTEYTLTKGIEITDIRKFLHTNYLEEEVRILDCPSGKKQRCIEFKCRKSSSSSSRFPGPNSNVLLLCYLSDMYLLETTIISEKEDILSTKYKILTITHSITFANLDKFSSTDSFFMSITIDAIRNNNAYCSAKIVQNNIVIACISQYGAIRLHKSFLK